jgi:hypothetical protein
MRYMLALFMEETDTRPSPEEGQAALAEYGAYGKALEEAGAFVAGDGLQPSATATVVRVRDGERLLTDGPFAETKEQLGGYYVIEARDLDEALDWAAKVPTALHGGTVEVRPVIDYAALGGETAGTGAA